MNEPNRFDIFFFLIHNCPELNRINIILLCYTEKTKTLKEKQMKNRKWMWCLPLALLAFFAVSPVAYGDLYWESVVVTKGVPTGMPKNLPKQVLDQFNKTETVKNYLTSNASRTDTSDGIMIMDLDTMTMYQLNTTDKTYTKVNMMSLMDNEMARGLMKGITQDMKITPANETKKIAGYGCKKYNVTMMGSTSEYWLSKDVEGYKEFRVLGKKMEKMVENNPGLKQMSAASMAGNLDGFPVQTVINVMGMTTTTTLKSIVEKALSKDLFMMPNDYKLLESRMPH